MSGHSKWKNIMHKKEKTDAQRAKVFTKIGKEIAIAVKEGGPDPISNGKLRDRMHPQTLALLTRFLTQLRDEGETAMFASLRQWVKEDA